MTTANFSRSNLETLPVPELRRLARELGKADLWVKAQSREGLINLLALKGEEAGEAMDLDNLNLENEEEDGAGELETIGEEELKEMIRAETSELRAQAGRAEAQARQAEKLIEAQGTFNAQITGGFSRLEDKIAALEKREIRPVVVQINAGKKKTEYKAGKQHKVFPALLTMVSAGCNVFLVGPAGSGKTRGGEETARALGRKFYPQSVGPQTTQSHLMGYMDASGKYIRTAFRDAFELGGLFLLDEIDAGNPGVLTCLNSALANTYCSFPDGIIKRHPDFTCIAAGNTWGSGADRQYVGRNQIDAATLDRFAFLVWDYDEALELEIAGATEWTAFVQKARARIFATGARLVVSPRASIMGNNLLSAGMARADVEAALIWKGADRATIEKVKAGL